MSSKRKFHIVLKEGSESPEIVYLEGSAKHEMTKWELLEIFRRLKVAADDMAKLILFNAKEQTALLEEIDRLTAGGAIKEVQE